ncbi:hypothetical protein SISNIDRAFT_16516 [Sistotremastrum niveocremeum HHB9708]|uniref:Nuclear speckle splicing regulatory protein 1 N-terminal domain-containing protein n=2 Tax=Sistotremastraceae TaxID=3402574 RepID=A0A165ALN7_9AGAM|nr:hypothetical protein SISNIDRAFT_16516 [Sistotremastrum niveocremeum HHB9708]KZT42055.1 hypothetical protein SISSUDRAFT_145345 [Sistotremastrum suecicum HHB10207 ss-3]
MSKLSFSLAPKSKPPIGTAPPLQAPPVFSALDDEDGNDAPTTSKAGRHVGTLPRVPQSSLESRAQRKRMSEEKKVDQTVYQYDEVWDRMQEAKLKTKEAKEIESKERKPKYIASFLNSAQTRKLDYIRAEEKMIQREREAEGDEFADKERFVTQAYKDQMAEIRRAEEEEKAREALERKKNAGKSIGMTHFYRQMLDQAEEKHSATVAAAEQDRPVVGPSAGPSGPNLTISKPLSFTPQSDSELAKIARAEGKEVELNDDNRIVDKRELLSAGLNLSAPNTRRLGGLLSSRSAVKPSEEQVQAHRAVGTAASRKEINERRALEIKQQLAEEEERAQKEKQREEQEARDRILAKRNNEDTIQNARERYLARKRRRLEEEKELEVKDLL